MIKFGVTSQGRFAARALRDEQQGRGWWPFAHTLLADFEHDFSERDEPLLERLYHSLSGGDGICKITRRNRFLDLDRELGAAIRRHLPQPRPIRIHDMAASNAITSLELFLRIAAERPVELCASDYFDAIHVVKMAGTRWAVVFDAEGKALEFVGPRLVVSARQRELARYPVNLAAQALLLRTLLPRASRMIEAKRNGEPVEGIATISLFHPLALAEAQRGRGFRLARDDLFAPAPCSYDVIRVMNALTSHHFPLERVADGVRRIAGLLTEGGLMVLGRSVDEAGGHSEATIFRRRHDRLDVLLDVADGFQHKSLVCDIELRSEPA